MQDFSSKAAAIKALCVALFLLSLSAGYAQDADIGSAKSIVLQVTGTLGAQTRALADADPIYRDETISTGADSAAKLQFRDDSSLTLGPNSDIVLDSFVYEGPDSGGMVVNASKGLLRFVSGQMRKGGVEIRTPAATMGIRGTRFLVLVLAGGLTYAWVQDGTVSLAGAEHTVDLQSGEFSQVTPGAPPTPPGAPPDDLIALAAEMDALLFVFDNESNAELELTLQQLNALTEVVRQLRESSGCDC